MDKIIEPCQRLKKKLWKIGVTVTSSVVDVFRTVYWSLQKWQEGKEYQRKIQNQQNCGIVKIVLNTKSPADLRWLVITQIPVKEKKTH